MKRKLLTLCISLLVACMLAFTLTACSNGNDGDNTPPTPPVATPTAVQVYNARQAAVNDSVEGYDFEFWLSGNFSVLGLGTTLEGKYNGQYRHDETTGQEKFKRVSSGELFFDGEAYSYTTGSQKIKLETDKDGIVKKSSIIRTQDEEGFFINKAVVGLVNIIKASNINDIKVADNPSKYDFSSTLNFGSNIPYLSKITSLFSNFGTKVAFKNVEFTNPTAIPFSFSIDENGKLEDFCLNLELNIKLKGIKVNIFANYEQNASNTNISIPQANGIITDSNQIADKLAQINNTISSLKNNDDYSLDVLARNEFDPAWNKLASIDYYKARLYKNTDDKNVWFNHSYEFKAHHEEDGAEKYKYTIGNIEDGTTHLVSRKGSNKVTDLPNVTVDTQFDYLTNPFIFNVSNIDCIKTETKEQTTTYHIHLNNESAISVQDKILDYVNANDADGVLDVNNYLNSAITIKDAEFVVVYENNTLQKISIKTDLKYNPTDGDYVDYNITLTNELELVINNKLSSAEEYFAPASTGSVLGIGASKYYIL